MVDTGNGTSGPPIDVAQHVAAPLEDDVPAPLAYGGGAGRLADVKVCLREATDPRWVADRIAAGLPGAGPALVIEADIRRGELLVEIECLWL